jgi:hypothetical protein
MPVTARDLFGVALRIFGLWLLYSAGYDLIWLTFRLSGILQTSPVAPALEDKVAEYKIFVAFYLMLAMILLVFADHITRLFYGPTAAPKSS